MTKKISILKNKQKFRIDNSEMKKFKLIPEINLSKGIEKTLIDLKKKKLNKKVLIIGNFWVHWMCFK